MYQQMTIVGNLGQDPEMRYMPDGTAVTNFSVATNRKWGDGETRQEETTWFRISVWGRQAETCNQYLHKGSRVLVVGRIKPDPDTGGPRLYTRQDGSVGSSFEVVAQTVRFMGGEEERESTPSGQPSGNGYATAAPAQSPVYEEDDIPF
jgi:single-strand DNA-binding protein